MVVVGTKCASAILMHISSSASFYLLQEHCVSIQTNKQTNKQSKKSGFPFIFVNLNLWFSLKSQQASLLEVDCLASEFDFLITVLQTILYYLLAIIKHYLDFI